MPDPDLSPPQSSLPAQTPAPSAPFALPTGGRPLVSVPAGPDPAAVAAPVDRVVERILRGPSGLGTAGLSLA
ncbi:2-methylisoborneol synthase, partial [Streptomyces sp. NPDC005904]